ncbi:hypothetical protein V6N13_113504 [Hibiscus sabdariffa]
MALSVFFHSFLELQLRLRPFNNRTSYWRKVRNFPKSDENEKKSPGQRVKEHEVKNQKHKEVLEERGDCSNSTSESLKRILGHVDEEALRRLERCVIGTSSTVCSSETIKTRLHNWGLGELLVKSLGGKKFLIEFLDEELLKILEEKKWAILEEVFIEVERWSETFRLPERITWVEITGIPLHCWNQETFKRITGIWGSLVALGENATNVLGYENISLLISTNQIQKIDEVIEIEAGRDAFAVRVTEPIIMEIQHAPPKRVLVETSFSKSSSMDTGTPSEKSINSDERMKAEGSGDHSPGSMDAFNEVCFGIHSHDYVGGSGCEVNRSIGEAELMGDPPKKLVDNFKTSQPDKIFFFARQ